MCDNLHPQTGEKLTPRTKTGRRVGYDINFHVPKSVSIALEVGGDRRIVSAFRRAVRDTMELMESEMQTRVRKDAANGQRLTGNMVWAEYIHHTARPVDGYPDPHLHAHCVAFNATYDDVEKQWKAGEFGDLKRDSPYFQAVYWNRFAENLMALGYEVERRGKGWELVGVTPSAVKRFSRRTEAIERIAIEKQIFDPAAKAEIGASSRNNKMKRLSMVDLRETWTSLLTGSEAFGLNLLKESLKTGPKRMLDWQEAVRESLDHGLDHELARTSVVTARRLMATVLTHGIGRFNREHAEAAFSDRCRDKSILSRLQGDQLMVTTPAVLAEERRMLDKVIEGRGTKDPIAPDYHLTDEQLSAEQQAAVRHILQSTDSVILLRGRAGTGKTRAVHEVVSGIESAAKTIQPLAPTGMATHEVLRGDGFKDPQTVAHLPGNTDLQKRLSGQVIWVDEAGLLSVPDLVALVDIAEKTNARLLLSGDSGQHSSVTRGDAMRLLESETGLKTAELTQVRRQRVSEYKRAAEALSRGDVEDGFERLDRMGAVHEADQETHQKLKWR